MERESIPAIASASREAAAAPRIPGRLDATTQWLRDADLGELKAGIERRINDHPGRALVIAVALGYLLGKALKR